MPFRKVDLDSMISGTVLAIAERRFPGGVPALKDYSAETGIAASTFRRAAEWLLGLLPALLAKRRPGPQGEAGEPARSAREDALRKLEDLRAFAKDRCADTDKNQCFSPEAKQRIAAVTEEIHEDGVLGYQEIASTLQIDKRQLCRIRTEVAEAGGAPPQPGDRRPHGTSELAGEIQKLILEVQDSGDRRDPYSAADVTRILNKKYKDALRRYHGAEKISETTVRKYLRHPEPPKDRAPETEHPRGNYHYPEPFQQVTIDTSYFKVFGTTFYLITVLELAGRLNLLTRVFLRENTAAVVDIVGEILDKYPQVEVVLIDRGKPYLNHEVKALLERRGCTRLVAPPATPTAKAAVERHFLTLKTALRAAIERVFPQAPRWQPRRVLKVIEMGVAVFQELYHRIPQDGIDGLSPAERIETFDPQRAAATMVDLFQRAVDSEPADECAREIHRSFQLPGDEAKTVEALESFGTRTLRQLVREVQSFMGPPHPEWMYDPLGFLQARAAKISRENRGERFGQRLKAERHQDARDADLRHREQLERERRELEERPEELLESTLGLLVRTVEARFAAGVRSVRERLGDLLERLAEKLGAAFSSEVARIRARIAALSPSPRTRQNAEGVFEQLIAELSLDGGT
jgi:transposase InsO family protein